MLRNIAGGILRMVGGLFLLTWGFGALYMCLNIAHHIGGFWAIVLGITILPATLLAAPWYAVIAWGNWIPLIFIYIGFFIAPVFFKAGDFISGKKLF